MEPLAVSDAMQTHTPLAPTTQLEPGEAVREQFHADRGTYWRAHAWLAAIAMAIGMGVLWAMGNAHVWTGAVGGLAAVAVRGGYLASDEVKMRWDLTDRRLLGPGTRAVELAQIARVGSIAGAVQVVTRGGDKHLIKYQPDPGRVIAAIEAARAAIPPKDAP